MTREALGHADNRPRIHIWPHPSGAAWSLGPRGPRTFAPTPGGALSGALALVDPGKGYVVIGEVTP